MKPAVSLKSDSLKGEKLKEAIVAKAFKLMELNRSSVWLIWPAVLVVYAWLVKADPAVIARSLINTERRKLENMLTREHLKDGSDTFIKRELRQSKRCRYSRTGRVYTFILSREKGAAGT